MMSSTRHSLPSQDDGNTMALGSESLSEADAVRWKKWVAEGKAKAQSGDLKKTLDLFKRALSLHYTDKLNKRITKLEDHLKKNPQDSSDSSDNDESGSMVHVGNGFYLHRSLYGKLYAHQREGVLFFWKLYKLKRGGILGDDMGLGKTIQVIAFLSGMFDAGKVKSVLIVAPVAVILNWSRELEKWAPGLNVYEFHSQGKSERERVLAKLRRRGGVCLTSYGIVVSCAEQLATRADGQDFCWDYVILDEGHKIKNPANKCAKGVHSIPAHNRIVLTGTPVMNNLKELWALYDWTHEGRLLGKISTFAKEYEKPIMNAREKCATAGEQRLGHEMSVSLQSLVAPYLLRRTKADVGILEAGNRPMTGSAPKMPTMTRKNDLIIWLFLSDIQKRIYTDFLEQSDVKELLNSSKSPLTALTVLKKICDHPRLMTNRQCVELGLHIGQDIDIDKLDAAVEQDSSLFDVSHIPDKNLTEESGKMVFLVKLLDKLKEEKHRCLVFSSSRRMLDILEKVMRGRGHRMCRLDGRIRSKQERETIIGKFSKDMSYSSFLLTTQVGGVGLTLTAADRVIIIDPSWNPATDSQAVDRAFRIGQTKNVVVYRLITCGSIEEKIYRRQIFKDSVTKQMTGDSKNPYRYFTRQELKELFTLDNTSESQTQNLLADMQRGQRKTDTSLDEHLAFLHSLEMYGVSDHDLMFAVQARSIVEGGGDVGDMDMHFVKEKVSKAQQLLDAESLENQQLAKETGKYYPVLGKEFVRIASSNTAKSKAPSLTDSYLLAAKKHARRVRNESDDEESSPDAPKNVQRVYDSEESSPDAPKNVQRVYDSEEDSPSFEPSSSSTFVEKSHLNNSIQDLKLEDECSAWSYDHQNYERPKSIKRSSIDVDAALGDESTIYEKPKDTRRSSVVLISDGEYDDLHKGSRKSLKSTQADEDNDDNSAHWKSMSSFSSAHQGSSAVLVKKEEVKRWSRSPVHVASDDENSNSIPYEKEWRKPDRRVDTTPKQRRSFIHTSGSYEKSQTPVISLHKEEMMFSPHHDLPLVSWRSVEEDDQRQGFDQPVEDASKEPSFRHRRRSSAQPPLMSLAGKILSASLLNPNRSTHKPNLASIEADGSTEYGVPESPGQTAESMDTAQDVTASADSKLAGDPSNEDVYHDHDMEADSEDTDQNLDYDYKLIEKWNKLMKQCKSLFQAGRNTEAYRCGMEALKINSENQKANNYVEKIRQLVYRDGDDRDSDDPELQHSDDKPLNDTTEHVSDESVPRSEELSVADEDYVETSESDTEEITTDQELEYVRLLSDSKVLYKEGHLVEALQRVESALEIYDQEDVVFLFREKLKMKINQQN